MSGGDAALDFGRRVNSQSPFRDQLSQKTAFDDGVPRDGFGVEKIARDLKSERALGFEIPRSRAGNAIVLQINIAAAPFAHRRLRGRRDLQLLAALKASDLLPLECDFDGFGRRTQRFLDQIMAAALLADGGDSGARFRLRMAAVRA